MSFPKALPYAVPLLDSEEHFLQLYVKVSHLESEVWVLHLCWGKVNKTQWHGPCSLSFSRSLKQKPLNNSTFGNLLVLSQAPSGSPSKVWSCLLGAWGSGTVNFSLTAILCTGHPHCPFPCHCLQCSWATDVALWKVASPLLETHCVVTGSRKDQGRGGGGTCPGLVGGTKHIQAQFWGLPKHSE